MASNKISIQERIRALNLQQEKEHQSSSNTPTRQSSVDRIRSSFNDNPASPRQQPGTAMPSSTSVAATSTSSPPSSEKAQLFKAAKVIQKSSKFEANRTRVRVGHASGTSSTTSASSPASPPKHYSRNNTRAANNNNPDEPTNVNDETNARPVNALVNAISSEDNEELDATAALQFWKTKGVTNNGPLSYKQAKKKGSLKINTGTGLSSNKASTSVIQNNQQDLANNIDSIAEETEEQVDKPPSPPDIVRTADADFSMEQPDAGEEHDICEQEQYEGDRQDYDQEEEGCYDQNNEEDVPLDHDANVQTETPTVVADNEHSIRTDMASLEVNKEEGDPSQSSRYVRSSSGQSMDGAPTNRAYTSSRRSRNRSSRRSVTSPDNRSADAAMFGDGSQSVVSAQSTLSSQTAQTTKSSLSSRATRFLREKNKRKGASVATCAPSANDVGGASASVGSSSALGTSDAQKILRGKASKARMRQKASTSGSVASGSVTSASMASSVASSVEADQQHKEGRELNLKTDSPFDETRKGRAAVVNDRPQTIDLQPTIPNVGRHYASPPPPPPPPPPPLPEVNQSHNNIPSSIPDADQFFGAMHTAHPQATQEQYSYGRNEAIHGHQYFDHGTSVATSVDESSCSELNAKDLFDTSRKHQHQQQQHHSQMKKAQSTSSPRSEAASPEFATFAQGKSFDNGCQILDAINPIIESAFNALSPGGSGQMTSIFGTNRVRDEDAPSDEDVAIEVEYVEQGEEPSYAETDSVFSVSTRDMDSYI